MLSLFIAFKIILLLPAILLVIVILAVLCGASS